MTNELLRKEPTIAHHDDIPVLNDRINVSWEKLSRVLEPVGMPVMAKTPLRCPIRKWRWCSRATESPRMYRHRWTTF